MNEKPSSLGGQKETLEQRAARIVRQKYAIHPNKTPTVEDSLEIKKYIRDFQQKIAGLVEKADSPYLSNLDSSKLDEIDLIFFRKLEDGVLTPEEIQRQISLLAGLEETGESVKFLHYLNSQLQTS